MTGPLVATGAGGRRMGCGPQVDHPPAGTRHHHSPGPGPCGSAGCARGILPRPAANGAGTARRAVDAPARGVAAEEGNHQLADVRPPGVPPGGAARSYGHLRDPGRREAARVGVAVLHAAGERTDRPARTRGAPLLPQPGHPARASNRRYPHPGTGRPGRLGPHLSRGLRLLEVRRGAGQHRADGRVHAGSLRPGRAGAAQ